MPIEYILILSLEAWTSDNNTVIYVLFNTVIYVFLL